MYQRSDRPMSNLLVLAGATLLLAFVPGPSRAAENVALGKTVMLLPSPDAFFTGGWGSTQVADPSTLVDGVFLADGNQWDRGPVWWDASDGGQRGLEIDLGRAYTIQSFAVQADNNDGYVVSVRDPATHEWFPVWDVAPVCCWGVMTRWNTLDVPVEADAIRVEGNLFVGDRLFAVSEVQAFEADCPVEGFAPSCTPVCRKLIDDANRISDGVVGGQTQLGRDDYLTLFAAVECRTGVPAPVLKAIASSEGLATQYEDPYPRQFIEPCAGTWNLNGWNNPQLFSRYYGRGWPLLAFDAPASYQCSTTGENPCKCDPKKPARVYYPPAPTPDAPFSCSAPPPPQDPQWATVWPYVSHVTLGNDWDKNKKDSNQSFGLGVMQVTFAIANIVQPLGQNRATWVGECYPAAGLPIYPYGGTPPTDASKVVPLDPLPDLRLVSADPQFDILLAAELILYKAQFGDGSVVRPDAKQVAIKRSSDRYGPILTAGPNAPQTLTGFGSWSFQGAQFKTTNSCTTTACVQSYIEQVLNYAPSDGDAGCFAPSPNRTSKTRTGMDCLYPIGHRFATEKAPAERQ